MAANPYWSKQPSIDTGDTAALRRQSLPSIIVSPNASSSPARSIHQSPGPHYRLPPLSKALSGSLPSPPEPSSQCGSVDNIALSRPDAVRSQPSYPAPLPSTLKSERDGLNGEASRASNTSASDRQEQPDSFVTSTKQYQPSFPPTQYNNATMPRPTPPMSNPANFPDPEPHPLSTQCEDCASCRALVQEIISNLLMLESEVQGKVGSGLRTSNQRAPEVARDGNVAALKWASDNIIVNLHNLRRGKDGQLPHFQRAEGYWNHPNPNADSKRRHDATQHDGDDGSAPKRFRSESTSHPEYPFHGSSQPREPSGHPRLSTDPSESESMINNTSQRSSHRSSHHAPSPSLGTIKRGIPSNHHTLSPNDTTPQRLSAQETYTQDLQHQLSVKTIALQALQREYNSLLQKIERQRAKCSALERKFEVTDTEINSLTDEKERLLSQVTTLEEQIAEVTKARDDATTQSAANSGQYMKIMQMSSRLQQTATEDQKRWAAERQRLEAQVKELSEAQTPHAPQIEPQQPSLATERWPEGSGLVGNLLNTRDDRRTTHQLSLIAQLETLRRRNNQLEKAFQVVKEDSESVRRAQETANEKCTSILHRLDNLHDREGSTKPGEEALTDSDEPLYPHA